MLNVGCDFKTCFNCYVNSERHFQLEGRDHQSLIDQNYTIELEGSSDSVYWRGFHSSVIVRNDTSLRWEIRDDRTNLLLAVTEQTTAKLGFFPLGAVKWRTTNGSDTPIRTTESGSEASVLRLSACDLSQFGCHDGLCIDMDYRCDMIHDCLDKSDEVDCHTLRNIF